MSEKFDYLLNKILGNYTKFDLIDFVRLKSGYSKNIFKLLKQWDSVRGYKVSVVDFKEVLGVSDKIQQQILTRGFWGQLWRRGRASLTELL